MSSQSLINAAPQASAFPGLMLAQSRQGIVDGAQQEKMERLSHNGGRANHSSDFTVYVLIPLVVCLGVILIGRRFFF